MGRKRKPKTQEVPAKVVAPIASPPVSSKMSLDELERILNTEEEQTIEILPNGEIRRTEGARPGNVKPLTFKENLGGEYA